MADRIQARVKALIDLGKPFVSLESIDDNLPIETVPLLLLAYVHSQNFDANYQMPDKVGLLLTRGANVKARSARGKTCLHRVFSKHLHHDRDCWCLDGSLLWRHQCRTKDIVILMITAGADVWAVDEYGQSVSDIAISSGQQTLWTEALKYCGIDIKGVLARPKFDPAHSTALSPEYGQPPRSVTSKMSFEEYLVRRKAFCVPDESDLRRRTYRDYDSSEDDESENEDSKSGDSPFEDDEGEDEDRTEDANENSEVDEQESDGANHKTSIQYESSGKAKLD